MGGDADADAGGAELLEPAQVVGDRRLPEPVDAAARVGDVEEHELDARLGRRRRRRVRLRRGRGSGTRRRRCSPAARISRVDPGVALADPSRCLTPGQVQHGLAPRPEVLALVPAAQQPLEGVAVRVDESGELVIVRHAREDTRVLRRLLVVGLAWAFFCAPAARARRHGRDLLLPLVRDAGGRRRLAALGPERPPAARPTSTRASSRRSARTRAATRRSSSGR